MEEEEKVEVEETEEEETQETTFTQSEVDSRISKAVESALSKREAKSEKEVAALLEKERNEAIEYQKLTEKEKQDTDYQKRVEQLEVREQELNQRQLLNQVESDLKETGLPTSLASILVNGNKNEDIKDAIGLLKEITEDRAQELKREGLRQDTPKTGGETKKLTAFEQKLAKYK